MFESPQLNYYVRDIETSARFYREHFGFTETFRTPRRGDPVHVELRLGVFRLGLATLAALREVHGVQAIAADSGPARGEIVLWTDDVDAEYAALVAKGVPVLSAPHDFLDMLRAAWLADPDGNPVQIVMRRAA